MGIDNELDLGTRVRGVSRRDCYCGRNCVEVVPRIDRHAVRVTSVDDVEGVERGIGCAEDLAGLMGRVSLNRDPQSELQVRRLRGHSTQLPWVSNFQPWWTQRMPDCAGGPLGNGSNAVSKGPAHFTL